MSKRFNICVPRKKRDGGTYWHTIGSAFESDKGINLVFDSLPIPDSEGRCVASLFEPRERDAAPRQQSRAPAQQGGWGDDMDDQVPY